MANIVLLFLCLGIGMVLRTTRRVPDNAHVAINGFIIHVSLPALILGQIHKIALTPGLLSAAAMPWMLFAASCLAFFVLGRIRGSATATTGALILSAGLANTSFVGLPMIETFYGSSGLPTGIIIDQLGTYLVLSIFGIVIACLCSGKKVSAREVGTRIATFPPFIALVIALTLSGVDYPAWVTAVLHRLGDTLAPLALVSVGLQLRLDQFAGHRTSLGLGLAFKLIIGPAILAVIYLGLFRSTGEAAQVTLFEGAMGPQIGGAIVAVQYGLDPPLVTLMVGLGIMLSFVTLPCWWWILQHV
ncbi:AEC family transporter [Lichenifustis flavocetrariae]|uniref:AEC family transporter n=1 Tax=Lichenifustis flavocetrariae TaxID=2949735 RepID=A0AA42CLJ8_9HYPH|nr:AEC family transporter [Lichenifustis flavocetrariae]MCW6511704.1 AEC family transporter [Lichenifustis flavocetrariae]